MNNFLKALDNCPIFDSINSDHVSAMLDCLGAKTHKYRKGNYIFSAGDKAGSVGIVLSGKVQIVRTDYYGNRSIIGEMKTSQTFGENFACSDIEHMPMDVIAAEDSCVMLINARRITRTCSHACAFHNRMIFNLLKIVTRKNLMLEEKISVTSRRTTRDKLLAYLVMTAKKKGSDSFVIPYDRQTLADYLGVDRSGLSAEISKLCKENLIRCHKSNFTLLHNPVDNYC